MNQMVHKGIVIFVIALCLNLFACATTPTKPNIPYPGPNSELDIISSRNLLLAVELRKLPELQDGISSDEMNALKKLVKLYDSEPDVFNSAFDKMYSIGLPDVRSFCTPLQALFWLMVDDKADLAKESIDKYDLK